MLYEEEHEISPSIRALEERCEELEGRVSVLEAQAKTWDSYPTRDVDEFIARQLEEEWDNGLDNAMFGIDGTHLDEGEAEDGDTEDLG